VILAITRSNGEKLHALLSLAVSFLGYVSWPYMRLRVGSTLVTIRLLPLSPNNEMESSVRMHLTQWASSTMDIDLSNVGAFLQNAR